MKPINFIYILKHFIIGVILLVLFHFETLSIGPLKLSHLWKGLVLVFLIFSFFRRKQKSFFIYKPLFLLAFLKLFNLEFFSDTQNAFISFAIALLIPLLGVYFLKFPPEKLRRILLFFSVFFILSFIPYELGLLVSIGDSYDLTKYGVQTTGLVGPFQGSHPASIALASSFIILLYFWFDKSYNRIVLSILILLGFYFLINTYVRTGMAMAILGVLPMVVYFAKKEKSTRTQLLIAIVSFSFILSFWVLNNNVLVNRILGQDKYSQEDTIEKIGSGRGLIYLTNIKIFEEANVFEKLFGIGPTKLMNRTERKIGSRLLSHNGFLQTLLANGIIGLIVLLLYFKKLYHLKRKLLDKHKVFLLSLLFGLIIMSFVQDYDILYFHILMMIVISIVVQESYMFKQSNNLKK